MKTIPNRTEMQPIYTLENSILSFNKTEYDLNNLDVYSEDNNVCYKVVVPVFEEFDSETMDQDYKLKQIGEKEVERVINFQVDKDHMFIFTNGNALRFYDVNCNDVPTEAKLKILVDYLNKPKSEYIKDHKIIYDKFFADGGTKKEWFAKGEVKTV